METLIHKFNPGERLRFTEEPNRPYTVRACNMRYAICTRPHPNGKDVWYTIIDSETMTRSTNDRVFNPYDYKSDDDCFQCLSDLQSGKIELSRRNGIPVALLPKKVIHTGAA